MFDFEQVMSMNSKGHEWTFEHTLDPHGGPFAWHDWSTYENQPWARTFVYIPYWWFAMLATMWVGLLVLWRKRRDPTDCLNCGYDLRGSKGACPECGTLPKTGRATT